MGLRIALGVLALGLAVLAYAVFWAPTEEEKIRAVLGHLERAVHTTEETGRNPLVRSASVREAFREIFDKDVTYRIPELTTGRSGREHLVELATRATVSLTTFDVDFTSIDVEHTADSPRARVTTVAELDAFRGGERYEQGKRKVMFDFTRTDGDWTISNFRVSPPLDDAEAPDEAAEGAPEGE
jgi:hypothetical protein